MMKAFFLLFVCVILVHKENVVNPRPWLLGHLRKGVVLCALQLLTAREVVLGNI